MPDGVTSDVHEPTIAAMYWSRKAARETSLRVDGVEEEVATGTRPNSKTFDSPFDSHDVEQVRRIAPKGPEG